MSARRIAPWLSVCVVALALARAGSVAADDAEFQVIVHPDNPVEVVDAGFLRDAYLKKTIAWRGGAALRPVDLTPRFAARGRFAQRILKKTSAQLRTFWNQRVFSGKGVPPLQVDSAAVAVAYVLQHPGAVAYLPAGADPGRAKVVEVR